MGAGDVGIGRVAAGTMDQVERGRLAGCGEVAVGPAHQADDDRIEVEGALGDVLGRERMHFNLELAVAKYLAAPL